MSDHWGVVALTPLELYRKWRGSREECDELEAWMDGFAAGCDRGYRRGREEGSRSTAREKSLLLAQLLRFLKRHPNELENLMNSREGTDSREDRFMLVQLLREGLRQRGQAVPTRDGRAKESRRPGLENG